MKLMLLFLSSLIIGSLIAVIKKRREKKKSNLESQQELQKLENDFAKTLHELVSQFPPLSDLEPDAILQTAIEKYTINTDYALVLYNKICFLKSKP